MWELREQLVPLGRLLETETGRKKSVSVVDVATPRPFVTSLTSPLVRPNEQLALSPCCLRRWPSASMPAGRQIYFVIPSGATLRFLDTTGAASYQSVSVNAADSKEITEAARGPDWRLARTRDERQGGGDSVMPCHQLTCFLALT